ncbi:hypothetical protein HDE_13175 [Halotydeus destructor]|nr:hypothetical protein HDE_13175 [Halotydeus destructor]
MVGLFLLLGLAAIYFLALKKRPKSRGAEALKKRFPTLVMREPESDNTDEASVKKIFKNDRSSSTKYEAETEGFSVSPSTESAITVVPKRKGVLPIANDEDIASTITYGTPTPKNKGVLKIANDDDD